MPNLTQAKDWIAYAQRDYDLAKTIEQTTWPRFLEGICYHSQQATEKALKAVLAYQNTRIPKTHDILELFEKIEPIAPSVIFDERIADKITNYAIANRYPNHPFDLTESDATLALKYARETIAAVERFVGLDSNERYEHG